MRIIFITLLFLSFYMPYAYAQTNHGSIPGYLVLREGDASTPLKFEKNKLYFEWENNDYAFASDWPSEGSFLVYIEEGRPLSRVNEKNLFGDFKDGYGKELSIKDGNNNGLIYSEDLFWPLLSLWTDKNANGYIDVDELEKLSEDPEAVLKRNEGKLSFKGKVYSFHSFLPVYDQINSRYAGEYTLDIETLFIPSLRGYGTVPDLHVAASNKPDLKKLVLKLCQQSPTKIFSAQYMNRLEGDFSNLMYMWADVEQVDPKSRGDFIDARQLFILEKILGKKFSGYDFGSSPAHAKAGETLKKAWNIFASRSYSVLTAQCLSGKFFVPSLSYNLAKDNINISPKAATLQTRDNIEKVLAQMSDREKQTFWIVFEDFLKNLDSDPQKANATALVSAFKGPPSMINEVPKKPISSEERPPML